VSGNLPVEVPFVNQNGKTGIIVSPGDPDALAKAINIFLDNPSLRKKYGSYAKKRVKEEFTGEINVN